MKLVDAMEKGSHNVRHVAGTTNDGYGGRCAIGMAQWAVKEKSICEAWPWTAWTATDLPCSCTGVMMGGGCIQVNNHDGKGLAFLHALVHLFNYHVMTKKDWSMDRLLKWVGCVEEHVARGNVQELTTK